MLAPAALRQDATRYATARSIDCAVVLAAVLVLIIFPTIFFLRRPPFPE